MFKCYSTEEEAFVGFNFIRYQSKFLMPKIPINDIP